MSFKKVLPNENCDVEIEVKRLHLPYIIKFNCPTCNQNLTVDLDMDYLSYPTVGIPNVTGAYCDTCDEYVEVDIKLNLDLEVDLETVRLAEE